MTGVRTLNSEEAPISLETIILNPVDYRFLLEAQPLLDPYGEFASIQQEVRRYYQSEDGRKNTFTQWLNIVENRKKWALQSINQGMMYSATVAGGAVWADAGVHGCILRILLNIYWKSHSMDG